MNGPKAIRDASVAADKKLSAFEVDLGMKKEVRPVLLLTGIPPITRFISFELVIVWIRVSIKLR